MARNSLGRVVWLTDGFQAASDTDALQFDDAVRFSGFAQRRGRDVVNRNSGRSLAIENTVVSVTVENSRHFEAIDWLFQPAGAEKGVKRVHMDSEDIAQWTRRFRKRRKRRPNRCESSKKLDALCNPCNSITVFNAAKPLASG